MRNPWTLILALALAAATPAAAQSIAPDTAVILDLAGRSVSGGALPFGQPIFFRGDVPARTDAVTIWLLESRRGSSTPAEPLGCATWHRQPPPPADTADAREKQFVAHLLKPLHPDRNYLLDVQLYFTPGKATIPPGPGCAVEASSVTVIRTDSFGIRGTTATSYAQRFTADFGLVGTYRFGYVGVISDVHVYSAPINKKEDLASGFLSFTEQMRRRVSLFAGLAIKDIRSTRAVTYPISIGAPAFGVGFRAPFYWNLPLLHDSRAQWILQPMRLNVGGIWFQQKDPNPLIDTKHSKHDVFLSLTLDFDYSAVLGPFVSLLSGK